jgi:beta-lactamase class A
MNFSDDNQPEFPVLNYTNTYRKMKMMFPKKQFWAYLCVFVLGMIALIPVQELWKATVKCDTGFDLLNPDSACNDEQEEENEWDYEPLRQALLQKVAVYENSGAVPRIALYFRDLKHGSRFGIRENQIFEPVSLLKLPIMMVILHEADRHPEFLDERLTYEKPYGFGFIMGEPGETLQLHSSYSVRELLQKMIEQSDNSSAYLLLDKINELGLQEDSNTFADLGTMQMLMSGQLDNTRLISLVNILVALYNANYLSERSSQFALELLTQTSFDQGIRDGVPENIRVAHKFGIRIGSDDESQLHDCGIVYHPSNPYVLCVLTAGADANTASAAIRDISNIVYENVDGLKQ